MTSGETIRVSHPFGRSMTADDLIRDFSACQQWEDRYRQLILLSRQLPALPEELRQTELLISGCENRVWLGHQPLADGTLHFYGDSDGRIVRGLLSVLLTAIEGKTAQQLVQEDPLVLFDQLGLRQQLSATRASGLSALAERVKQIVMTHDGLQPI